jgi:hypothetical protein
LGSARPPVARERTSIAIETANFGSLTQIQIVVSKGPGTARRSTKPFSYSTAALGPQLIAADNNLTSNVSMIGSLSIMGENKTTNENAVSRSLSFPVRITANSNPKLPDAWIAYTDADASGTRPEILEGPARQ